jgi:hypothetical protein
MKAGTAPEDLDRRLLEAERIRNNAEGLPPAWQFIVAGDFNIQGSGESSYLELTGSQPSDAGRAFDPVNTPGAWNNNGAYRFVHTQDPATQMDDRFDFLLIEAGLRDGAGFEYIGNAALPFSTTTWNDPDHSLRVWGNDGGSYNQPLTTAGNTMVGSAIAQAITNLAGGLGHCPLFLDLRVPPKIASETLIDFGVVAQGATAEALLNVSNNADISLWTIAGIADLAYSLSATAGFSAPAGVFVAAPGGGNAHVITMDTSTPGPLNGTLVVASNSVDEAVRIVTLTGEVTPASDPDLGDLNCDGQMDFFDIDPFLLALFNPTQYGVIWFDCDIGHADCNEDGTVDFFDIDAFLALLFG